MTSTGLQNLDHQIHTFNLWLKELDEKLHWQDRRKSYKTLQVVLQTVRDHLTVHQSAHFSAQLPMIARGIYYDGWVPSQVPIKSRNLQAFYEQILDRFDQASPTKLDPQRLARAVFDLLNDHVSGGEIDDVRNELPRAIRQIWPDPTAGDKPAGQR